MRRFIFFMVIFSLIFLPCRLENAFAREGDAGAPGAFLKLGSGVRALSMGKAFVALADDASASYWNPAGLIQIKGGEISLMYAEPFGKVAGITHQNIAYARETRYFNYGLNFIYAGVEGLERYNTDAESAGNFGSQEWALLTSLAYSPSPRCAWGTTFKLVNQKIEDYQANGFGADLGLLFKSDKKPLRVGITCENLTQPAVKLRDTVEYYPRRIHYGIMFKPFKYRQILTSLVTADLVSQTDTVPKQFYGTEIGLYRMVFLRGGYNTASLEQSFGSGLKIKRFSVDYAYLIHPYLGDTHRAGLALKF